MAASITVSRCARAPIAFAPWRKNTRRPRGLGRSGGGEFSRGGEEIEVAARAPGLSARAFDLARHSRDGYSANVARARTPRRARPPPSTRRRACRLEKTDSFACQSVSVAKRRTRLTTSPSLVLPSQHLPRGRRPAAVKTVRAAPPPPPAAPSRPPLHPRSPNASVSVSCSIDDPSTCSRGREVMYIDALWTTTTAATSPSPTSSTIASARSSASGVRFPHPPSLRGAVCRGGHLLRAARPSSPTPSTRTSSVR